MPRSSVLALLAFAAILAWAPATLAEAGGMKSPRLATCHFPRLPEHGLSENGWYKTFRPKILRSGYFPVRPKDGSCPLAFEKACKIYPEIDTCFADKEICLMAFRDKAGDKLIVETVGDAQNDKHHILDQTGRVQSWDVTCASDLAHTRHFGRPL